MYCLHLLSYHDSLIHLWTIWYYFRPRGVAVVAVRHFALVGEFISEPASRASKFKSLRNLTTSVWLRSVDKEEGLFTGRAKHVVSCISVNMMKIPFVFRNLLACVIPRKFYLLDKTRFQNSDICEV
jgi:hypothetical protein